eukprot:Tamp_18478.p1 GENE.Tamp_18478~~Tamp_18478.p1  ORF type:complete len:352 (-),score=59.85 Tamp_18478:264-1295(-)
MTSKFARSQVVLGGVDIKGQELHVALYGEQMTDTAECALLVLRELQWQVQIQRQEKASDLDVYRFLELDLDTCILMRMKKGGLPKMNEYHTNPQLTVEHIKHGRYRLAGSEWILHVPHAKHELDSVQTGSSISSLAQPVLSSVVKCEFDAPSYPLEVCVEAYLFEWLGNLVRLCRTAASALETDELDAQISPPPMRGGGGSVASSGVSPSSVVSRRKSGWKDKVGKKAGYTYTCLHLKWDPQLIPILPWGRDDLADLTAGLDIITILGWLGVESRERICGTFHGVFINSVEKVLKVLVKAVPNVGRGREGVPERLGGGGAGGSGGGAGMDGGGPGKRNEQAGL